MRGMMNFFTIFYEYTKSKNTHCPIPNFEKQKSKQKEHFDTICKYLRT